MTLKHFIGCYYSESDVVLCFYNVYVNNTESSSSRPSQHLHPCMMSLYLHDSWFVFLVAVCLFSETQRTLSRDHGDHSCQIPKRTKKAP